MRRAYVIWHWGLTLLIAPFTSQAFEFIYGASPHEVVALLEIYPLSFLFSIAFSLPTFLLYLLCFYFLSKQRVQLPISKLSLIAVSVIGIYVTQSTIKGSMSKDIIIAYSATAIIVGLVLNLKDPHPIAQNSNLGTTKNI